MPKTPPGFVFLGYDEAVMLAVEKLMPIAWGDIESPVDAVIALKIVVRAFLLHGERETGVPASVLEERIDEHAAKVKIELADNVEPLPVTKFSMEGN